LHGPTSEDCHPGHIANVMEQTIGHNDNTIITGLVYRTTTTEHGARGILLQLEHVTQCVAVISMVLSIIQPSM